MQDQHNYVRWGRTSYPNVTGTELVYSGRAGGTSMLSLSIQGGGAEKLCLPDPAYLDGTSNTAIAIPQSPHVHSGEYFYFAGPSAVYTNTLCLAVYAMLPLGHWPLWFQLKIKFNVHWLGPGSILWIPLNRAPTTAWRKFTKWSFVIVIDFWILILKV